MNHRVIWHCFLVVSLVSCLIFIEVCYAQNQSPPQDLVEQQIQLVRTDDANFNSARDRIVKIGGPAVEPLVKILADSSEKTAVRQLAVVCLFTIKDKLGLDPLIKALSDHDDFVADKAAYGLGLFGDSRAVEPLIAAFQKRASVQPNAVWALGELKDPRSVEPMIQYLKQGFISGSVGGFDRKVLAQISSALSKIGKPALVPLLDSMKDLDDWSLEVAARVLGNIGDTRAIAPLRALLDNKSELVRTEARNALEKLKSTGPKE